MDGERDVTGEAEAEAGFRAGGGLELLGCGWIVALIHLVNSAFSEFPGKNGMARAAVGPALTIVDVVIPVFSHGVSANLRS